MHVKQLGLLCLNALQVSFAYIMPGQLPLGRIHANPGFTPSVECLSVSVTMVPDLVSRTKRSRFSSGIRSRNFLRSTVPRLQDDTPSLRDQMKAYLEMIKARGMELNMEQKKMMAEIEADEALLAQGGRVDFGKGSGSAPQDGKVIDGAGVMSGDDEESRAAAALSASIAAGDAPAGGDAAGMGMGAPAAGAPAAGIPAPEMPAGAPAGVAPASYGTLVEPPPVAPTGSSDSTFDGESFRQQRAAAARAAALAEMQQGEEAAAPVAEVDPVTGLPVKPVSDGGFGDAGYGLGVGGASANRKRVVETQPSSAPPLNTYMPAPHVPPTPAQPVPPPASTPPPPAQSVQTGPSYAAPDSPASRPSPAAALLWTMQQREREEVARLLSKRLAEGRLSPQDYEKLRATIASVMIPLADAD